MRSDNPCDCPYVPIRRIHPRLLWIPLIDFFLALTAGIFCPTINDIIKTKVVPFHRFKNSSELIEHSVRWLMKEDGSDSMRALEMAVNCRSTVRKNLGVETIMTHPKCLSGAE